MYYLSDIVIEPNTHADIETYIAMEPVQGTHTQLALRSSLSYKGVSILGAFIYPDYRGNIISIFQNLSPSPNHPLSPTFCTDYTIENMNTTGRGGK